MFEIIKSGGWLMIPIIVCSVLALAIVVERGWVLRRSRIAPADLLPRVMQMARKNKLGKSELTILAQEAPLGRILASGIINARHGRDIMKESIQDTAAQVVHEMERYLSSLGTIAAVTPLLGLLGTVVGMIRVFANIMIHGTGEAAQLAGGISEALITTAAGLTVAIPALFFHRFYMRRIEELSVAMESDAIRLVEMTQGQREQEPGRTES